MSAFISVRTDLRKGPSFINVAAIHEIFPLPDNDERRKSGVKTAVWSNSYASDGRPIVYYCKESMDEVMDKIRLVGIPVGSQAA